MDFTLEVGGVTETTEVTAVTSLITTENATVGTVIENRRIVELPLNGRNYLSLIALSPNVSAGFAGAGQAGDRQGGSRANQQISISGQRREFNYYTLDGVDNTDVNFNTYIFLPSVDALEEFKVQTGIYSAEFGRAAGQVNVVTKSGSNAFHGTVFEFHRNDKFDARPYAFTAAQAAAPKPDFKWHQFGYTADRPHAEEPAVLHVELRGLQGRQDVPDPLHRADGGDAVGRLLGARHAAHRSGDVHASPARRDRASRSPGNRIPTSRISPISQKLLEFYPEPNASGTENNYISQQDRVIDRKQYTQRMDFVQSSMSNWMGRYSWSHDDEVTPALVLNGSKLLNTHSPGDDRQHLHAVADRAERVPLRLQLLLQHLRTRAGVRARRGLRAQHSRRVDGPPKSRGAFRPSASPGTAASATARRVRTPTGTRCSSSPTTCPGSAAGTRSRSARSIRFDQYNQVGNQFSRGSFTFDGRATGSATGAATSGGAAFADFLLGYMRTSESAVALATTNFRAIESGLLLHRHVAHARQHDARSRAALRVHVPPWLDKGGTLINAYLPYQRHRGCRWPTCRVIPCWSGSATATSTRTRRSGSHPTSRSSRDGQLGGRLVNDDKLNFAPRVGWAWTPSDSWSLRAGAGIFYMQDTGNPRFDMARNAAGRRQDTADPLLVESELERAVRRIGHQRVRRAAAAGLRGRTTTSSATCTTARHRT